MQKIGKWTVLGILGTFFLPLALGTGGAIYFGTSVDSLKMRSMAESMTGKPAEFTSGESFRLMLSRILPIPLIILGIVGEWYWAKTVFMLVT